MTGFAQKVNMGSDFLGRDAGLWASEALHRKALWAVTLWASERFLGQRALLSYLRATNTHCLAEKRNIQRELADRMNANGG
jgi:hypothetical protein